jgi:predicted Rossmann fold nucleotide-binding protein DprA/Smf involved in DNA uptake
MQVQKPSSAKKKPGRKPAVKKQAAKKTTAKRSPAKDNATVLDQVFAVIRRSRKGVNIAQLKESTKLEAKQLSNSLYKLTKKGKIKTISRGVYKKV